MLMEAKTLQIMERLHCAISKQDDKEKWKLKKVKVKKYKDRYHLLHCTIGKQDDGEKWKLKKVKVIFTMRLVNN